MDLGFETIGNATVIVHDRRPVLVTDPWLRGGAYFGSWGLGHAIPPQQLQAALACPFVWLSHAHPDHLSAESLELLRGATLLLPDHVGGRVARDLRELGYTVRVLPDRTWTPLSERVRVWSLADYNQDGILLIDVGGTLVLNLNDANDLGWGRAVRAEVARFPKSFLLCLSGYGDADMINFRDESGRLVPPHAKQPFGAAIAHRTESVGARFFVPFSSMHVYQRADSVWANEFTTPIESHAVGFASERCEILPAYIRVDAARDAVEEIRPEPVPPQSLDPREFGDDWSEPLEREDAAKLREYFARFARLGGALDWLSFRVGGREERIELSRGPFRKGLTFEVPRGSLMTAVKYRVFDDLLIGNFMKTTLHGHFPGDRALYPDFTPYVAKYGDNGGAYTRAELRAYFRAYRERAGLDYLRHCLEDEAMRHFRRVVAPGSPLWSAARRAYWWLKAS